MRVKVGDTWYECLPGQPIMVELLPGDRENIKNMSPEAKRYALFDDTDKSSLEEKFAWMSEGAAE